MARAIAITTFDNPFDPINNFDEWFAYDRLKGYGTCEYLARVATFPDSLPQEMQDQALEEAIDQIISSDPLNLYKKVVHNN